MSEANELYAYFTIVGDFDPEGITCLVGTTPTKSWRKGDINPQNQIGRKFSRWSLYSRLERTRSLEEHMNDVIEQLAARKEQFVDVSRKHGGTMQLVGYFKTDYPGLHFSRQLTELLAEYSLEVDFDFYYLYSDCREDS